MGFASETLLLVGVSPGAGDVLHVATGWGGSSRCGSVVGWGGACMGRGRGEDPEGGLELAPRGTAWPALRVGWLWGGEPSGARRALGPAPPLTLQSVPVGAGAGGRRRSLGPDHGREGALLFHCRDDIGR